MDKKVNKILILSMRKDMLSSLENYINLQRKYLEQKEDYQVEYVDLYSKSFLKRLWRIIFYKNEKEFDCALTHESILMKALVNNNAKSKVGVIHDWAYLAYHTSWKGLFWKPIFKHSLKADKLVFISRFAKEQFIDFYRKYQIPQNKVIYGGINDIFFESPKKRQKQYDFIHIARNAKNKNFEFVLQILKHFNDKKLLRIGKISPQDASFIKAHNLKVSVIERCSEEDKKKYLEESKILLFPSLYEGFGLPPVEAAASNCYVLSANNTGLLESNLEENLLPLEKSIWIDRINKIFSEEDEEILRKQREFAQSFRIERFFSEVERFIFKE